MVPLVGALVATVIGIVVRHERAHRIEVLEDERRTLLEERFDPAIPPPQVMAPSSSIRLASF